MNSTKIKRNSSLDIARIIAVLAIVMTHCSAGFTVAYDWTTKEFAFANIFNSASKIGVPFFLMISGALFLDERKEVTINGVLRKNVLPLAILTAIWSVVYSLLYNVLLPLLFGDPVTVEAILHGIAFGHFHLWYLFMIIGIYMIAPFLKKFACQENKGMVLFFITISFVAQFSKPIVNVLCELGLPVAFINQWLDQFELDFFGGYITYFLVGWYIVHIGVKQKWLTYLIYLVGLASFAFIILYSQFTGRYAAVYSPVGAPVFLCSVGAFLAVNNRKCSVKEKTAKRLAGLSKLTFGVYILHVILISALTRVVPYRGHILLYIAATYMVVIVGAFCLCYVISKIPVLKKLIRA